MSHKIRLESGQAELNLTPTLNLRAHVFSLDWMWTGKGTGACMRCACCKKVPAVEAIELQGLPNGNALHL